MKHALSAAEGNLGPVMRCARAHHFCVANRPPGNRLPRLPVPSGWPRVWVILKRPAPHRPRSCLGAGWAPHAIGSLPAAPSVRYSTPWLFCWRLLGRHGPWDPKKPAVAARAERWRSLAERAALEMRCTFGYRGFESRPLRQPSVHSERCWSLAEQARLESVCTRKGTVGSNPTRSAIPRHRVSCNQTPATG